MSDASDAEVESFDYSDIERWYKRFDRAMGMFSPAYDDDGFNDLVAISVAGVTMEAFLHLGVGAADAAVDRSRATLGFLITLALQCDVVSVELKELLEELRDIRNAFTHFIDYRIDAAEVEGLYKLLPASKRSRVDAAAGNIVDGPSVGARFRLVLMSAFHAVDLNIRENVTRILDERGVPPFVDDAET
jgi:hypothetical protein